MPHPYRDPETPSEPTSENAARLDDAALAVILFVVGAIGLVVGLYADRATELTVGLLLVVLSVKVAREARQSSI